MKSRSTVLGTSLLLALWGLAAGCGSRSGDHAPASRMSEAQRDTAIARSQIPGAGAVGRALDAAGGEAVHSAQVDSVQAP